MPASINSIPAPQFSDDDNATVEEIKTAYENYTHAVELRLKPGLDAVCELRDQTFEQLAELEQTSRALDVIDAAADGKTDSERQHDVDETGAPLPAMKTRVNLGEEFYVQAHVHKLDVIVVDVGLGIMVEMTRDEVREFIKTRKEALESQGAKHSKRIAEIQAHLKTVMKLLSQLKVSASGLDYTKDMSTNKITE